MASLAALITAAIIKVAATNPAMDREDGPTADEARDAFTEALLIELGLASTPVAAHAPVTEAKTVETVKKTPKKRAAKKAPEVEADVVAALTAAVAELTVAPAAEEPKPKKARKTKVEPKVEPEPVPVPASNAGAGAEPVVAKKKPGPKAKVVEEPAVAPAAEKKKPGPKPKAKPEGPVNVEKLTPTHKKHIKAIAEELHVTVDDKGFLAYANAMSAEQWAAQALDDHIRAFASPTTSELAPPPTEFLEVEFNGKDYLVNPETNFIYTVSDGPTVKARTHVGVVGMLEFKDMEIPEADE
jgi:hypothetical protein